MGSTRIIVFFISQILAAALLGQMREPGSIQNMQPPQPQTTGSGSGASLSTDVTSAPIALGPGDLLDISVFDTPELLQKVRVNSDGKITLALIGELTVVRMTPDAAAQLIRQKLIEGHFVKNPQVSVFVAEYAGQLAYVSGEVNRPGAYPLLRQHGLSDLIAAAGGLNVRAGNAVTIAREGNAAMLQINLADAQEVQRNPEILPGDRITVSQTGIVYVLGDVTRAGGFLLNRDKGLTAVQAIALAEGASPSAALSKTLLIRTVGGARQEIPLDLRRMFRSENKDVALQEGDVIFVPGSAFRGLGRRSIDTILATASGVAIYAYRP